MQRRVALAAVLVLAVVAQIASVGAPRPAVARQGATGVTGVELGSGTGIQLYSFTFDAGASIDQQEIAEPMLVYVLSGSFVFYIPETAGDAISFRVDDPNDESPVFAVDSTNCTLPLEGDELQLCEFADTPSDTELECDPSPPGNQNFVCASSDKVGILVREGTTLVLPGPTECMVCKLDIDAGEIEVAVAAPPGDFAWWRAVGGQSATPSKRAPAVARLPVDPCNGLVR